MHSDVRLIIGIGNEFRGDDAIGIRIARALRRQPVRGLVALEASGEGASLLELWDGWNDVVLVDTVVSGRPAGTVHRIDLNKESLPSGCRSASTHSFGVFEAIELARVLGRMPERFVLIGIEGQRFEAGSDPHPAVYEAESEILEELIGRSEAA